ncbi:MAG TPA: biosynthetic-type acetolactate synthase large subunit [Gaiellales bacterium]|nr:biosynthetic-type acetolactate synthase large subunit [Gaiellales bacterium]
MTGAEAVIRCLEAEGVTDVFGLPGGAILPLYDAWAACDHSIRHYLVRHEQGAGHMAQGYARATGKVGVAIATSGPGATNLVTPIADAYLDSTPIVCITGQVPTHLIGTDAFQEADIQGITMPIVKHSWLVDSVEEIPRVFKEAFHIARTGRPGPVLVDIPKDLQLTEFEFSYPKQVDIPGYKPSKHGHPKQVITAAEAILAAERPTLYVGGGAVTSGLDPADLIRVAQAAQIPVVTTLQAKGAFPDSHPLCIGLPGMHGSKAANWAMNRCDLLIACGARFDDRVTGKLDVFAPGARVIHMDVDPAEIGKNRAADIPIVGSLEHVIPKLAEALESRSNGGPPKAADWLETVQGWQRENPFRYRNTPPLKPEFVIERLRELTRGQDVVWTTGVGQHQMWAAQYLEIDKPRRWLTSGGAGTMGFGVPAAIGAKVGRPDAIVINIDGDGCFQMTMQELATAKMYGIAAIHVVVNNGWLGMVRQWQELFHGERFSETLLEVDLPDYVKLAESFGIAAFRCETTDEVDAAITAALECGGPCVIDARVDHEEKVYPMVPAGASSADMIDVEWAEDDNAWVEEGV